MLRWLWRGKRTPDLPEARAETRLIEDDLSDLASRMISYLSELESARKSAQEALPYASDEAEKSRHVDRIARFAGYRDTLTVSSSHLEQMIDGLRSAHALCAALERAVRSGQCDPKAGRVEVLAIRQVIQSLDGEESIDEVWLRGVRSIKREFDVVLANRARRNADERRGRKGLEPDREFMIADKNRGPKPTGQRDGLVATSR